MINSDCFLCSKDIFRLSIIKSGFLDTNKTQSVMSNVNSVRTELRTVSDQSGATAFSGFSSRYSLKSWSIGEKAAPTYKAKTFLSVKYNSIKLIIGVEHL